MTLRRIDGGRLSQQQILQRKGRPSTADLWITGNKDDKIFTMKRIIAGYTRFLLEHHPVRLVALGYLTYVVIGWILLSFPFTHNRDSVTPLDALFTACSAVSTTGLVTVSTGNDYNILGQIVILVLIQLGGIGYMTFGSFVILSRTGILPAHCQKIGHTVFSLPQEFRIEKFIRSVMVFTFITETIGALALFLAFRKAGLAAPLWSATFHSVSAFCTAGFSLYDTSFESLRDNLAVNAILCALSYLGAMGFIVFVDAWRRLTGKTKAMTLTSRIIIITTTWISAIALALFFIGEPSIRSLPLHQRLLASVFQVMASITTVGFNTIPIGRLTQASLFVLLMLMIIGASPAGTGGGLKTTTFTAILGVMKSALQGRKKVVFWGRTIPEDRVWAAMASLGFYTTVLVAGCYLLSLVESFPFESLFFECASALGTVGLSTGITSQLAPVSKLLITLIMFVGRLGPLGFGLALSLPQRSIEDKTSEDLAI